MARSGMAMRMMARCILLATAAACGSDDPAVPERPTEFGGDRPVELQIPLLTEGETYPLVLILHGYGVNGFFQQAYFGMNDLADRGMFVLAPDGLVDSRNKPYWNADSVCCDFDGAAPDDSGYLRGLLDEVSAAWPIDRDAVFAVGHANGGHMAYRLACDHADALAGIVVIAANGALEPCTPARPVSALHMHGTADAEFHFDGDGPFQRSPGAPGAAASIARWAGYDGCDATRTPGAAIDLDSVVPGAETHPEVFGCPPGLGVELWTMEGTEHLPGLTDRFVPVVWPWLLAHARGGS